MNNRLIKHSLDKLEIGLIFDTDIIDENKSVLVPANTALSEELLRWMHMRHITFVYTEDKRPLAESDLGHASTLVPPPITPQKRKAEPQNLNLVVKELYKTIRSIQNPMTRPNMTWYHKNTKIKTLDSRLSYYPEWDKPKGNSLSHELLTSPRQRTIEYKQKFIQAYLDTLSDTKIIIDKIADGTLPLSRPLSVLVERIIELFIKDRNMLINCSNLKSQGDENLYHHSLNVCIHSINIATATGYSYRQISEIAIGALLHDIGMIFVLPEIRYKTGSLTPEELAIIQKHPLDGLFSVSKIKGLPESIEYIIYQHHEREDGSGYPKARHRNLMHRYARIVAIADMYDAMTCPRPYRKAIPPYQAMLEILTLVKRGKVSNDLMRYLMRFSSLFPVGSYVKLSDERIAKVIDTSGNQYLSPVVVTIDTGKTGEIINLAEQKSIKIIEAVTTELQSNISLIQGF
ncbi:MAG: HD domain-containing protein [Fibrobacteria bacterium]|nr:HD domain-containing protein [Fibrobacteria bacterium]